MSNLGYSDDLDGDIGEVDLFGLDEFGQAVGLNQMWGAVIGGGLATGAAIAVRAIGSPGSALRKWSEGIGFLVGAGASAAMMAFPGTRAAGWAGLATAFATNGLRQIEQFVLKESAPGLGVPVIERLNGWHGVQVEQIGSSGVAESAPPVSLMGSGNLAQAAQDVHLLGGPQISGLASHYGATLFG